MSSWSLWYNILFSNLWILFFRGISLGLKWFDTLTCNDSSSTPFFQPPRDYDFVYYWSKFAIIVHARMVMFFLIISYWSVFNCILNFYVVEPLLSIVNSNQSMNIFSLWWKYSFVTCHLDHKFVLFQVVWGRSVHTSWFLTAFCLLLSGGQHHLENNSHKMS